MAGHDAPSFHFDPAGGSPRPARRPGQHFRYTIIWQEVWESDAICVSETDEAGYRVLTGLLWDYEVEQVPCP